MMERYKLEIVNDHGDRYIRCEPATDGSWVMFKDVEAQAARIAELEDKMRQIQAWHPTIATAPRRRIAEIRDIATAALEGGKS